MEKGKTCSAGPLTASTLVGEGAVRIAPLLGLPRLLAEHGVDVDATMRAAGLDPALFDDPENTVAFACAGRLLEQAAAETRCDFIGLELCGQHDLDVLGMVGRAVRSAPDVASALRTLVLHLHLHDRGAVPALWTSGGNALLGYTVHAPDVPGVQHIYDCALAVIHNIVRELAGPGWRATEVRMFRDAPDDRTPYRRLFRAPLRFGAHQAAVCFPKADLRRPLVGADAAAFAAALRDLESLDRDSEARLASKVQRVLRRLFITGNSDRTDLAGVARLFSHHPRTLNRRLRAEGTTFASILAETRFEIARQLLRDTRLPVVEIARTLGYSDSTAFSHAFRHWSGSTATAWRSRHRQI